MMKKEEVEEEEEEGAEATAAEGSLATDEVLAQGPLVMVGPLQATTWLGRPSLKGIIWLTTTHLVVSGPHQGVSIIH